MADKLIGGPYYILFGKNKDEFQKNIASITNIVMEIINIYFKNVGLRGPIDVDINYELNRTGDASKTKKDVKTRNSVKKRNARVGLPESLNKIKYTNDEYYGALKRIIVDLMDDCNTEKITGKKNDSH